MSLPTIFKKKFYWTIEGEFPAGSFGPYFVKCQTRPGLNVDDVKYRNTTTIIFEDPDDQVLKPLYNVLQSIFDFREDVKKEPQYGSVKIKLLDSTKKEMELWSLIDATVASVDFGDLGSELMDLEVVWSHKNVFFESLSATHDL